MSLPGQLTPSELAPVSNDQVAVLQAQWFNRANGELIQAFGYGMVVLSPYGGYRTCSQQAAVSPGTSCAASDHTKGHAIDVDNHRRFRNANQTLFLQIMNRNGWYNQQINGQPFPSEPWHFRNKLTTAPAGGPGGITPITEGAHSMYLYRDVQNGGIYLVTPNGRAGINAPAHVTLIQRMFKSYPNYDNFYGSELDIIYGYILAAQQGDDAETAKVLKAIADKQIDTAAIAAAAAAGAAKGVEDALADQDITVEIDYDKITADVEAALQDEFARQLAATEAIPDAVVDEQVDRLKE